MNQCRTDDPKRRRALKRETPAMRRAVLKRRATMEARAAGAKPEVKPEAKPEVKPEAEAASPAVGQLVDVESKGSWYPAKVVGSRAGEAKVHYNGWKARYDEWLPAGSARLRVPGAAAAPAGGDADSSDDDLDVGAMRKMVSEKKKAAAAAAVAGSAAGPGAERAPAPAPAVLEALPARVRQGLVDATARFYSKIPHSFGLLAPPVLLTVGIGLGCIVAFYCCSSTLYQFH
jgi:hypothetical protein